MKETNKLIAEFMGMTQGKANETRWKNDWFDTQNLINSQRNEYLFFDTKWDWLMPVIEKIESIGYCVEIKRISVKIYPILNEDKLISSWVCGDIRKKKEITYDAIIGFIKWYNTNKS